MYEVDDPITDAFDGGQPTTYGLATRVQPLLHQLGASQVYRHSNQGRLLAYWDKEAFTVAILRGVRQWVDLDRLRPRTLAPFHYSGMVRQCSGCRREQPLDQFGPDRTKPYGYDQLCLICNETREAERALSDKATGRRPWGIASRP